MIGSAKRLTLFFGAALLLAGCFLVAPEGPYSHYFIVAFLPGTPALSQPGLEALGDAVSEARRSTPREIVIHGAAPEGAPEPELEKQRTDAVFAAFAKANIDTRLIHVVLRPATEKGYEERKESLIIQFAYGKP